MAGLIAYLLGPGRHEEHHDPRVIAGSDNPALLQPEPHNIDSLVRYLNRGVAPAGLPVRAPRPGTRWEGHHGYVWHISVRLAPGDPHQSDARWSAIAQHLMRRTGILDAGCRWVAIRHGEDHIHLAVTLVHRDRGQWRRFHPRWWKRSLRAACRELEDNLGLTVTADANRTATPLPTRAEQAKAERRRLPVAPRVNLRELVSDAAATAMSPAEFFAHLREDRLLVRFNHGPAGDVRGYAVALPVVITRDQEPVYFSGSKLAPELSWPNLLRRWENCPAVERPTRAGDAHTRNQARVTLAHELADAATAAAQRVRTLNSVVRSPEQDAEIAALAEVSSHLVHVFAAGVEHPRPMAMPDQPIPHRPLLTTADHFARTVRLPRVPSSSTPSWRWSQTSDRLRRATVQLARHGPSPLTKISFSPLAHAQAQLVLALASLVAELAAWHEQHRNIAQAKAATQTASVLANAAPRVTHMPTQPPVVEQVRTNLAQRPPPVQRTSWPRDQGRHR